MTQSNYSASMVNAFHRFFSVKSYNRTYEYTGIEQTDIRFNNHNFNPVFIRISSNQEGKVIEIPSLINNQILKKQIVNKTIGESVAPLNIIESQVKNSSTSIFKYFFSPYRPYINYLGLKKITTLKGKVYYGAPGLILDSNFEPIIIGLVEYKKEDSNIVFERHVLKVNPNVFISDDFLEKAIIKKLIPFYTRNITIEGTVRVEVDDISKYIVKPVPPKAKMQETMKEMMQTYKDEILSNVLI